ncbi:05f4d12e-4c34-47ca-9eeb-bd15fa2afc2d [Thermothielavioides terrestris]|uniref:05f4d12e-4c34-47ca-9eeb-bd15fa2afc2d n=1 Tax=Thermothielavioides terrestris TaxID=2587410 RepID=A0A446BG64_9PEZI|nr:05f4d12e-4c34-47ca-9eeb-bd15fa2afc2d [Thermothielavioides terrestris]
MVATKLSALALVAAALLTPAAHAFSLYPTVNGDALAQALGISSDCLAALNETVSCDDSLFSWTVSVDDYWWEADNLTTLCTPQCTASAATWVSDVLSGCINDDIVIQGKAVPAASVAERFGEGLAIACLQTSKPAQADSAGWCMLESQNWVGSDVVRPDCTADPTDPSCSDPANVTADNARLSNLYPASMLCSDCFLKLFNLRLSSNYLPDHDYSDYLVDQLQDIQDVCSSTLGAISTRAWGGYPDATTVASNATTTSEFTSTVPGSTTSTTTTATTTTVVTPTPTQSGMVDNCDKFAFAVANSTCFDIAQNNSITLQDFYMWNAGVGTDCQNLWANTYYCVGIELPPGFFSSSACQTVDLTVGYFKDPTANCEYLSLLYNVTTGDLLQATQDDACYSDVPQCLPPPCQLVQVANGSTWAGPPELTGNTRDALASSFSTPALNVTTQMFLSWNPNIIGPCENLTAGQYVCADNPGGSYAPPALAPPDVGAGGQERGGPGGWDPTAITGTPSLIVTTGLNINPTAAPQPTQPGIAASCTAYSRAAAGDTCASFAAKNAVAPDQLYAWNPVLGAGGADCATEFWAGYYYCVAASGTGAGTDTPTATPTTTTTPSQPVVTAPGPTQTGIAPTCNKFAVANAGDTCDAFARANGITPAQLYAWNSVLGLNGENCATSFWAKEYYCVGVSGAAKVRREDGAAQAGKKYIRGVE